METKIPRHLKRPEIQKRAKARRIGALARNELRQSSEPRESAAGATSYPVKKIDTASADAIAEFMAKKNASSGENQSEGD